MKKNQNKSELEGIFWFVFLIIAITITHVNRWNLEGYWELILYGVILIIFAIGIYKAMEKATEFTKHNIRKIQ